MSDEIDDVGGSDEGGGSTSDVLREFAAEEDKPEPKEPEEKEPPREAKPEPKEKPKAEAKKEPEKKDPPAPKPRHKVKVDGEETEVDEDELLRGYQRASSVTKKAQALAQEKKQIDEAKALAKKDPAAALKLLGLTPEEYAQHAEKLVFDRYSREFGPDGQPLSPEQKELARLRAEAAERETQVKAEQERQRQEEEGRVKTESERHWVKTLVGKIEARGEDKFLLPRVAQHLSDALEADQGLDPADLIDDAIDLAKDDAKREVSIYLVKLPYDRLEAEHPELVEHVRKGMVAKFKASRAQPKPQEVEAPEEEKRRPREQPIRSSRDALRSWAHG